MHIAICDDNIADRKQTERLIKREADKVISRGGTLYFESFGNCESLLFTPMQYDLFIIDVRNTPGTNSFETAKKLRDKGVGSPICIMYMRDEGIPCIPDHLPDEIRCADDAGLLFLAKPVRPEELSSLISRVEQICESKVSQIELRGEFDTLYVSPGDILYAERSGLHTLVTLSTGKTFETSSDVSTLFDEIKEEHLSFVMPSVNYLINIDHIASLRFHTAQMKDNRCFKIGGQILKYVKAYLSD